MRLQEARSAGCHEDTCSPRVMAVGSFREPGSGVSLHVSTRGAQSSPHLQESQIFELIKCAWRELAQLVILKIPARQGS